MSFVLLFSSLLPSFFFFFNDTATTEIYTLSLHDALPISHLCKGPGRVPSPTWRARDRLCAASRSEEHTSELQSRLHLVCRLLLEKKKKRSTTGERHTCTTSIRREITRRSTPLHR